jgi:hypothetical protein
MGKYQDLVKDIELKARYFRSQKLKVEETLNKVFDSFARYLDCDAEKIAYSEIKFTPKGYTTTLDIEINGNILSLPIKGIWEPEITIESTMEKYAINAPNKFFLSLYKEMREYEFDINTEKPFINKF